ncbi:hypothetical protein MMPV_006314 [Pyropia vietnamensis]
MGGGGGGAGAGSGGAAANRVLALALDGAETGVWVSTPASTVRLWRLDAPPGERARGGAAGVADRSPAEGRVSRQKSGMAAAAVAGNGPLSGVRDGGVGGAGGGAGGSSGSLGSGSIGSGSGRRLRSAMGTIGGDDSGGPPLPSPPVPVSDATADTGVGVGGVAAAVPPVPAVELPGLPAVVAYRVLNNKREVLVEDAAGVVSTVNVTSGRVRGVSVPTPPPSPPPPPATTAVATAAAAASDGATAGATDAAGGVTSEGAAAMTGPPVGTDATAAAAAQAAAAAAAAAAPTRRRGDLDPVASALEEEVAVLSWFTVDFRTGALTIKLEASSAFKAEVYAVDAGLSVPSEEVKVNIGEHVIRALFGGWHKRLLAAAAGGGAAGGGGGVGVDGSGGGPARESSAAAGSPDGAAANAGAAAAAATASANSATSGMAAGADAPPPPAGAAAAAAVVAPSGLPPYVLPPDTTVAIIEEGAAVPLLRRRICDLGPDDGDALPPWVADVVWERPSASGGGRPRDTVKLAFQLAPEPGSGLLPLKEAILNAPRVLRARKIAAYAARSLREEYRRVGREADAPEESALEVVCNGRVVPGGMSLATIKQFLWRELPDMELTYRLKGGGA